MNRNDFKNVLASDLIKVLKTNPGNSIINVNEKLENNQEGLYILLKDIHCNQYLPTTIASEMLANYQSSYNATIIDNLLNAGFSIAGTTNLDEFAMGSTTKTSYFKRVENAIDPQYVSGGSSGGSAYAVSKGLVAFATGTDTGGSVRQPSAYNGTFGLKPTYGLVSRYGTIAFASSFDTIGPITSDLYENAYLLQVLASNDEKDQTNYVPTNWDPFKTYNKDIKGMKIGVMRDWLNADIDPIIKNQIEAMLLKLESLGAIIVDVQAPLTKYSFTLYMILAYAEASSNLNRYDGIRYGFKLDDVNNSYELVRKHFGKEVKKRLIIGTYMLGQQHYDTHYKKALALRNKMCEEFKSIFNQVDAIVGPTTPNLAFKADDNVSLLTSYLSDQFSIPANLVGFPSLNVPIGQSADKRYIGMQIMADKYQEHIIYQIANNLLGGQHV